MSLRLLPGFNPGAASIEALEVVTVGRREVLGHLGVAFQSAASGGPPCHRLLIGARGMGKTHLVSLLVPRIRAAGGRVAWLPEDAFGIASYRDLSRAILKELGEPQGWILRREVRGNSAAFPDALVGRLRVEAGTSTTLIVVENLDRVLDAIGEDGQRRWRALLQEAPKVSVLATTSRVSAAISDYDAPFYGFFSIDRLKPLTEEQSLELTERFFEEGERGSRAKLGFDWRAVIPALYPLTRGIPRLQVELARALLAADGASLIDVLARVVDVLAPGYEGLTKELSPQQRVLVTELAAAAGAIPVKELASRVGATPQTVSYQLKQLRDAEIVQVHTRGRTGLYELADPVWALCSNTSRRHREYLEGVVAVLVAGLARGGQTGAAILEEFLVEVDDSHFGLTGRDQWIEAMTAIARHHVPESEWRRLAERTNRRAESLGIGDEDRRFFDALHAYQRTGNEDALLNVSIELRESVRRQVFVIEGADPTQTISPIFLPRPDRERGGEGASAGPHGLLGRLADLVEESNEVRSLWSEDLRVPRKGLVEALSALELREFLDSASRVAANLEALSESRRGEARSLVREVVRTALPWIYDAETGEVSKLRRSGVRDRTLDWPAATTAVTEILMAGIDARPVDFLHRGGAELAGTLTGANAILCPRPALEGGMQSVTATFEAALDESLIDQFVLAGPEFEGRSREEKLRLVSHRLESLSQKGRRTRYVLLPRWVLDELCEGEEPEGLVHRLREKYPALVFLALNRDLDRLLSEQSRFEEYTSLLEGRG